MILKARGIVCSMSRRGNCYDNDVMESFFSSVKGELCDQYGSKSEAKMELFDCIQVFYRQRLERWIARPSRSWRLLGLVGLSSASSFTHTKPGRPCR